MLNFSVITIFPQMFASPLGHSILKRAREKNLISVSLIDLRDYATDRHRMTDDYPYGGGQGMVMKPEPLVAAIEDIRNQQSNTRVIAARADAGPRHDPPGPAPAAGRDRRRQGGRDRRGRRGPGLRLLPRVRAPDFHPHATVLLDPGAAAGLARLDYYREVYAGKPSWQGI